ncbi:MAG: type IV secretory system conjugative DNA transfer family protein [Patescibacteria group bacterium]
MTPHTILEIRTGRDAEHTPETAVQFLSTLPKLHNNIFYQLISKNESFSLEIFVRDQTIKFLMYLPVRLMEYVRGAIIASYPEALITENPEDPIVDFFDLNGKLITPSFVKTGSLGLTNAEYLPMKTYLDFKNVDPLASLLASLSKSQPSDIVHLQYLVSPDTDNWKNKGWREIQGKSIDDATSGYHRQKALIEEKLKKEALKVGIKLAVRTDSAQRSDLILETLAATYNSISKSEGNTLVLRKNYFFKEHFLKMMQARSFFRSKKVHLTLDELATLYHLPNKNLEVIPNIAWGKNLLGEPPENLPIITRDTDPELKNSTNVFAETTYKNKAVKYGLKRADRRRHMYVIGKTGTGKSTLLANMAINDLKNNEGMCVIDPHGDLVETLLNYIPSRRINDVIYFDPSDPERTVQINLFEGKNVVHRELIASGIISIFQKLYGYSWGPRLEYILRNALLTLLTSENARLSDILELLTNKKFRDRYVENLEDPILKSYWVDEYNKMQDRLRTESIASILNKVGQFTSSPLIRNVVNAHKSSFSIEDIMNEGKILLVNLSQGKLGEDNATLLGAMMITKIQLAAMTRVQIQEEQRRDFYLYVDEFQNFATEAFIKILSEARKYRLNLTLANQYIAQIPEEVQKAIFGNCGSTASFVMGSEDAQVFSREFGEHYTPEELVSLEKYQIINRISIDNVISKPFPARTLGLAKSSNQNKDKVIKVSRERYSKKRQ